MRPHHRAGAGACAECPPPLLHHRCVCIVCARPLPSASTPPPSTLAVRWRRDSVSKEDSAATAAEEEQEAGDDSLQCIYTYIEMVDMNRDVDVAVIDEVQMIASPDRGWAWTRAVLGLPASELHLCGEQRSSRAACAPPLLPACASPGPAGLRVCISRVACVHACACILVHACMCVFVCHGCVRAHVRCVVRLCTRARACVQCVRQIRGAAATALRHVRRHLGNTRISASDTPRGTVSPMMCVCVCVCAGKHAPSPPTRNPKPETLKPQP